MLSATVLEPEVSGVSTHAGTLEVHFCRSSSPTLFFLIEWASLLLFTAWRKSPFWFLVHLYEEILCWWDEKRKGIDKTYQKISNINIFLPLFSSFSLNHWCNKVSSLSLNYRLWTEPNMPATSSFCCCIRHSNYSKEQNWLSKLASVMALIFYYIFLFRSAKSRGKRIFLFTEHSSFGEL